MEVAEEIDSRKLWSLWYLLDYGGRKEGHKLSHSEVLQLKQLRNFTKSNRQNNSSIYLYFKLKIS
jgi:hypothetical protein